MESRNNIITFRLSDSEIQPFIKAMELINNGNRSEFFRTLFINGFDLKKIDKNRGKGIKELVFYFNKTSNNINQIAKQINKANLEGNVSDHIAKKYLNELILISSNLNEILKRI